VWAPRAGLDSVARRENTARSSRESIPSRPTRSQVNRLTELPRLLGNKNGMVYENLC